MENIRAENHGAHNPVAGVSLWQQDGGACYFILREEWTMQVDNVVNTLHAGSMWSGKDAVKDIRIFLLNGDIQLILDQSNEFRFSRIEQIEYDLLRAVSRECDRLVIHQDRQWIQEGIELNVGDCVKFHNIDFLPPDAMGVIRFKGHPDPLKPTGILFGIELNPEYSGRGNSDGIFKNRQFFQCGENNALFRTLKSIRSKPIVTNLAPEFNATLSHVDAVYSREAGDKPAITVDETVVWLSDEGPERGVVRWIGQIADLDPIHKWYAGVEFERRIGKGTGRYRGLQLFSARKDHASLVPLVGLLKFSDFQDDVNRDSLSSGFHSESVGNESSAIPYPVDWYNTERRNSFDRNSDKIAVEGSSNLRTGLTITESSVCSERQLNLRSNVTDSTSSLVTREIVTSYGPDPEDALRYALQTTKLASEPPPTSVKTDVGVFNIGDRVQVSFEPPRFGVIRWFGKKQNDKDGPMIVGLEMDTRDEKCYTHGNFDGRILFRCSPHKSLFIHLNKCRPL